MKFKTKVKDYSLTVKAKLGVNEELDEINLNKFSSVYIRGFMKPAFVKAKLVEYTGAVGISLFERMAQPIEKHEFLFLTNQVISLVQKIESNGFDASDIVNNLECMFINKVTKELNLIYLPVCGKHFTSSAMELIDAILYAAKPATAEDERVISKFAYFLKGLGGFEADKIAKFIAREDPELKHSGAVTSLGMRSGKLTEFSAVSEFNPEPAEFVDGDMMAERAMFGEETELFAESEFVQTENYYDGGYAQSFNENDFASTGLLSEEEFESTGLLVEDEMADDTILVEEDFGSTGLLVEEDFESTGLLVEEDFDSNYNNEVGFGSTGVQYGDEFESTGLLYTDDAESTGILEEEACESTGILAEDDVDATGILDEDEAPSALAPEDDYYQRNVGYPVLVRLSTNEQTDIDKPVFRIGKEYSEVDYFVGNNGAVSRKHADIITRETGYFVVDLGSKNHTFVNEVLIPTNIETAISNGDRIRLGNEVFVFTLKERAQNHGYCVTCGRELQEYAKYCIFCGTRV